MRPVILRTLLAGGLFGQTSGSDPIKIGKVTFSGSLRSRLYD
jgi:hypothetical protein